MRRSCKKLLLIGGSGIVGTAINKVFADDYNVISPSSKELNIFELKNALQVIQKINPDLIIYAASLEWKDEDTDEQLIKTYHAHVRFPLKIMPLLKNSDSRLITFSGDTVFPKNAELKYIETDNVVISSLPTMLKITMESLLSADERCMIIRLSRVFGPSYASTKGPLSSLLGSWFGGNDVHLITDVKKSYTYSVDAARMLLHILQSNLPQRLFHIANSEETSMFGFFSKMAEYLPGRGRLIPVSSTDLSLERNPKTTLLTSRYLPPMRPWHEAVQEYCREYF